MKKGLFDNITLLAIIRFSKWFMLYMPIVKLFYEQNGLNNFQLFSLHAVHSVVIGLLEVPSGYFADRFGRRNSLIIGTVMNFTGFLIYSLLSGYWGFLIAELAIGIGVSFVSGSDSALLYDTLAEEKRERDYMKFEGRLSALGNFAESFAGLAISGIILLGVSDYRFAYVLQSVVALIGIPSALMLTEPGIHVRLQNREPGILLTAIRTSLIENKLLRNTILYSSIIGFSTLVMAWFTQILFYEVGLDPGLYGIVWTVLNLIVGLGSLMVCKIENRLGMKKTNILILVFIASGFFIPGLFTSLYAIPFLFVFYFVRGIATPALKNYINQIVPTSQIRATVMSIRSLIIRLFYALLGPLFGWISDTINLKTALLMAGFTVTVTGSISLIILNISQKKYKEQ